MKFTTKLDSDYRRLNKIKNLGTLGKKGFISVMSTQHRDTLNVISNLCYIKIHNYSKQENNSIMKEQNLNLGLGNKIIPELDKAFDTKKYAATKEITRKQVKAMLADLKELKSKAQNSSYVCTGMYKVSYNENDMTKVINFDIKFFTAVLKLLDRIMLDNKLDSLEFYFMATEGKTNLKPMLIQVGSAMQLVAAPVRPL